MAFFSRKTKVTSKELGRLLKAFVIESQRSLENSSEIKSQLSDFSKEEEEKFFTEMFYLIMFAVVHACEEFFEDEILCHKVLDAFHDAFYEELTEKGVSYQGLKEFEEALRDRYAAYRDEISRMPKGGIGPGKEVYRRVFGDIGIDVVNGKIELTDPAYVDLSIYVSLLFTGHVKAIQKTLSRFKIKA